MYAPNINITNQYFMSLMIVLKKRARELPQSLGFIFQETKFIIPRLCIHITPNHAMLT